MKGKLLLINFITVIVLLVVLELMSRIVLSEIYTRHFDSSLIVDNKYGTSAGLKENAQGEVWGKQFSTDAYACRKNKTAYRAGKKKWLFIGDSVTEGVGVDDTATFSSIVAASTDSLNVMNYSLIGYSVADYYNLLSALLSRNDSSVSRATIFFCLNDVYGPAKSSNLPVMAKQNWKGAINGFLQDKYATYKLLKLMVYQNSDSYFRYDSQFYEKNDPRFIAAMDYLGKCDSLCRSAGVKMDVVLLPYRSQLHKEINDDVPVNIVGDYCHQKQIPYHSATLWLQKAAKPSKLYLFADEIHFSEAGHLALAHYILSL